MLFVYVSVHDILYLCNDTMVFRSSSYSYNNNMLATSDTFFNKLANNK